MAKNTPEGKVKHELLKFLKTIPNCFYYMPVQNGMGQTGIPDVMAIIYGVPFCFEVKATPKHHPTSRQALQLQAIHQAGGIAWVVDNESVKVACELLSNKQHNFEHSYNDVADFKSWCVGRGYTFYRWEDQLKAMEFESGTGS